VIRQRPFLVLYNTVFYPEVFDEFTRAGIVTIGGSHFHRSHYERGNGLRWDYLPDGSTAARMIADYYCRRMAGSAATHGGSVIHPSIGERQGVPRRLGVIVQQDETNRRAADELRSFAQACQKEPVTLVTFENDINSAAAQSTAITNRLIQDKVTTVVCMCPTGAMTIFSPNFTSARYFPEHLLPGIQWLDNDVMARSFDAEQWRHAFGPSLFPQPLPYAKDEAQRVWAASGREGELQCNSCRFWIWQPMRLLGELLQGAGPNLTAATFAQAGHEMPPRGGWIESGGDPTVELLHFGPTRFTAVADVREVYWDPAAPSAYDGQPGAYIAADGGRRHPLEGIPRGPLPFPPAPS
jgi:hypothetical protein